MALRSSAAGTSGNTGPATSGMADVPLVPPTLLVVLVVVLMVARPRVSGGARLDLSF